jgi:hypothetical protein
LKPAVIRIALGRERFEHPRFVAMRSHYGYDSFFCAPGIEGAHEKGGVEGEIGRFRRRHLTAMPHVGSWDALNAALAAAAARDDARRIGGRAETVGAAAARELPLLTPLPVERFDVALRLSCRVDAKARICVRQSYLLFGAGPLRQPPTRGAAGAPPASPSTTALPLSPRMPAHCTNGSTHTSPIRRP